VNGVCDEDDFGDDELIVLVKGLAPFIALFNATGRRRRCPLSFLVVVVVEQDGRGGTR
jgi:hypothetical protein